MAKFKERRRVRRGLPIEIDADEGADGLAVVDRVFNALIRQAETLLGHVGVPTGKYQNFFADFVVIDQDVWAGRPG